LTYLWKGIQYYVLLIDTIIASGVNYIFSSLPGIPLSDAKANEYG